MTSNSPPNMDWAAYDDEYNPLCHDCERLGDNCICICHECEKAECECKEEEEE